MKKCIRTIVFFIIFAFSTSAVYPCSCDFSSPRKKLRKAKAVFIGEVIEIGENDKSTDFPVTMKLKIEWRWKGAKETSITVVTTDDYCYGIHTSEGEKFLIYAYKTKEGQLETNLCVSMPLESATDDLKIIGKGKEPKLKS